MKVHTLIFAEKPSQGRAYASAYNVKKSHKTHIELNPCSTFPSGAVITWGIGHLVELATPQEYDSKYKKWDLDTLPINPDSFIYKWRKDLSDHIKVVQGLVSKSEMVIIASDIDREGELIAWLVFNQAGIKTKNVKRLWINSLVEEEIRKGFNNLRDASDTYNLYLEAQARQQADWLVGINLSRLYSLSLQKKGLSGSISIGRVQTPLVKMIYDRQKEINNFVSKPFYHLKSMFQSNDGEYEGVSNIKVDTKAEMKEALAKYNLTKNATGVIKSITRKEKRNLAPSLHTISSIQEKANKIWKYSPDSVLETVQGLYEKKIVTYPRTDCKYITQNEFAILVDNVEAYKKLARVQFENKSLAPNKRFVDDNKVKEHFAIIPTQKIPTQSELERLSEQEHNIYQEILLSTLAMFHGDYIYEETEVITDINGLEFKTKGRIEKEKGWRELSLESSNRKDKMLPDLTQGEQVNATLNIEEGKTSPPKPYTEGQLIRLMETAGKLVEEDDNEELEEIEGIGTGATRAGIIEKVKEHKYIEIKKNIVHVTKKGEILCEAVEGTLLASPTMTAKWETYLKKIGKGTGSKDVFLKNVVKFIDKTIIDAPNSLNGNVLNLIESDAKESSVAPCPSCGGLIVARQKFYGCTGYSTGCRVSFPKTLGGKNMTKTIVKNLCEKGATSELKGFVSKNGKPYKASLVLDGEYNIKFIF